MTKVNLGKDTSGRPLVLDDTTLAKIRWAEAQLGWTFTIIQGSYMAGIGASRSGGTHDAGGAVDLRTWDIPASIGITCALTALRESGLIAWYRPQAAFPDHEIHALDYGDPNLSPAARAQVTVYLAGRNGLSGSLSGPDDGPKVTVPKTVPTSPEVPVATSYVIDASHYQAGLKVAALKAQGYAALIIKCTEGSTYADPSYADFLAQAEACGMPVAAYHFLHAGSADKQAAWLAKCIRDPSVPVMIDAEAGGKPRWADITAFVAGCVKRGLKVTLLYLPRSYWAAIGSPSLKGAPGIVNAAYPSSRRGYGSALYPGNGDSHWDGYGGVDQVLWQFASSCKVDGYPGNVDVSAFRGTPTDLAAYFHTWGAAPVPKPSKPTPAPTPPTPKDWFDMATQADLTAAIQALVPTIAKAVEAELRVSVPPNEDSWPGQKDVSYRAAGQRVLGQLAELRAENAALRADLEAAIAAGKSAAE